jgi:MFS family permease
MGEEKKRGRKEIEKHNTTKTAAIIYSHSARFILVLLSSTLLVVMFSETMLLPAIPEIMQDFNIPYSTAAWIFSAYLIVAAVMTPIAGKLSDIYGSKKVLLTLLVLYIVGVVIGGFSENISFLLTSRIIQGVGLAAVPVAFSIIRDSFPPDKLAMPVGVFSSAASGGSIVGLLVGASIIQNFGWHVTFFFIAPAAVIVTFMIARFVPTGDKPKQQHLQSSVNDNNSNKQHITTNDRKVLIDIKGAIALSATITSFLIALTFIENGESIENSMEIAGISFIISAVSLITFIFIEKRTKMPLIDLWLLKQRILLPSYIMMIITGTTIFLVYPTIVQLVRSPQPAGFGGDAVYAAYVQLPFMIVFLIFSSATSYIISKIGKVMPTVLGGAISIVGAFGLLMLHSTGLLVSINLTVIAIGLALTMTALWNLIVSSAPKEFMGISTGIGALLSFIGMAIGPALAGTYMHTFHMSIEDTVGLFPSLESFNMIFLTAAVLSAVSLTFSLLLMRRTSTKFKKMIT